MVIIGEILSVAATLYVFGLIWAAVVRWSKNRTAKAKLVTEIQINADMTEAELTAAMEQLGKLYSEIGDVLRQKRFEAEIQKTLKIQDLPKWQPKVVLTDREIQALEDRCPCTQKPENRRMMDKAKLCSSCGCGYCSGCSKDEEYDDWDNGLVG